MGYKKVTGTEREARMIELCEAWFDGWAEGVGWALAQTVYVLRQDAVTMESSMASVIEHLESGISDTSRRPPWSRGCGEAE